MVRQHIDKRRMGNWLSPIFPPTEGSGRDGRVVAELYGLVKLVEFIDISGVKLDESRVCTYTTSSTNGVHWTHAVKALGRRACPNNRYQKSTGPRS
eukprot:COSAG02_NODE_1177_length_14052_cov_5.923171_4_plen_96_part_00